MYTCCNFTIANTNTGCTDRLQWHALRTEDPALVDVQDANALVNQRAEKFELILILKL